MGLILFESIEDIGVPMLSSTGIMLSGDVPLSGCCRVRAVHVHEK